MGPRTRRVVDRVNSAVVALRSAPLLGRLLSRGLTVVTYTGRRSGRTFSTPVGYRRTGETITIKVMMADSKNWWRNFLGDGAPIALQLDGVNRTGHAVARRDGQGRVSVTVQLHQA
ncbi:nitroreductase/quinone reductase family protein [Micromonospora sp. CA-263727]|uniref:nitroreductase/quinone reductase family protein n=1 Tax=Micromonospora sp. CA-263727 TaxID=3239967 RepID=UPI003D908B83